MEITNIKARDLNEAWWLCIRAALEHGREYKIDWGSYAGQKRKELEFVVVQIDKPGNRPLVPIVPEGLPVPTNMDYVIEYFSNYLMSPGAHSGNEQYTYGEDVAPQFWEIVKMYKEKGFNINQACISVGNRDSIYLKDPQCLRVIDTRIIDSILHFFVYFRSWDLFAGFPSNLAAIQLMKEEMAQELGVEDGGMIATSKGLHLYDHFWDLGKAVVGL
jgi:thymidylate synthase